MGWSINSVGCHSTMNLFYNTHPTAHLWGWAMGCLPLVPSLCYVFPLMNDKYTWILIWNIVCNRTAFWWELAVPILFANILSASLGTEIHLKETEVIPNNDFQCLMGASNSHSKLMRIDWWGLMGQCGTANVCRCLRQPVFYQDFSK